MPMSRKTTPLRERMMIWLASEDRWVKRREVGERYTRDWKAAIATADSLVDEGLALSRSYQPVMGPASTEYLWKGNHKETENA